MFAFVQLNDEKILDNHYMLLFHSTYAFVHRHKYDISPFYLF